MGPSNARRQPLLRAAFGQITLQIRRVANRGRLSPTVARACAVAIVLAFSAPAAAADRRTDFAVHVPGDACLAAFSEDVAATCGAFQTTDLGKTFCGDGFAPLIKELTRRGLATPLYMRPAFGFDWNDLAGVREPGGMAIFPLAGGAQGSVWLFITAQGVDQTPACLAVATEFFKAQGYRATTEQRAIGTLTVLTPPAARKGATPRAFFTGPGLYGVANSPAAAEAILSVKAETSLAAQGVFKQLPPAGAQGDPHSAAAVSFCVRPIELRELIARSQDQSVGATQANRTDKPDNKRTTHKEDHSAKARRLGWDALQYVAGRVRFDLVEPCQWQIDARVHAPGPYRGAMRMLELKPGPFPELPPWIRANVISAGFWRWDFPLAMKGFGSLYDEANEPGPDGEGMFEDMLDGLRDDPEGVQIDLRRDVFAHVTPEMVRISAETERATADQPGPVQWLYVAGVNDAAQVRDTFARFYKDDDKVAHARAGDYDLWTIGEGGSLFVEGESDSLVTVRALAVGANRLMFCTDTELLKSAIEPQAAAGALGDDPQWARLLGWIKAQEVADTALRSLVRLARVLEPSYEAAIAEELSEDAPAVRLWRTLLFGSAEVSPDVPRALAPKYDRLRGAFPPAAMVMSRSGDDWILHIGAVAPASPR